MDVPAHSFLRTMVKPVRDQCPAQQLNPSHSYEFICKILQLLLKTKDRTRNNGKNRSPKHKKKKSRA